MAVDTVCRTSKWEKEVANKMAAETEVADDRKMVEEGEWSKPQPVYNNSAPVNAWGNARKCVNVEPRRPCRDAPYAPCGCYCGKTKGW